MKHSLSLVALATAASFAAPVQFGADALVGYDILSIGSDLDDLDAKAGFGVAVGPTASYAVNDKVSIGAGVSFLYNAYGVEASDVDEFTGETTKFEADFSQLCLGFQFAPSFKLTDKVALKAGYEWDMPLSGSIEEKSSGEDSEKRDIVWAPGKRQDVKEDFPVVSVHNILIGGSYAVTPTLAVALQGKFALNGFLPDYDEDDGKFKGAAKSSDNIAIQQLAVGVNYTFGL